MFAFELGAEHVAAEARAVAEGNARAGPVFISGAAGMYSAGINGFYSVTEEKSSDGRVVLSKRGDPSMCVEHRRGHWEVLCRTGARMDALPTLQVDARLKIAVRDSGR